MYSFTIDQYPNLVGAWKTFCIEQFDKPYMSSLSTKLHEDYDRYDHELDIYPAKDNVFKAFELTPFENLKVVLLSQDPYIREGQAMGLSFSVPKGVVVPPSLVAIYKEIEKDLRESTGKFTIPKHGDLTEWAKQGVLLLNAVLTVREGKSASHAGFGWKTFTEAAIRKISDELRGVVFLLWGKDAQSLSPYIDQTKHYILRAGHPSPLNTSVPFSGCGHFSKTNELLAKHDKSPIDWNKINTP